jgi:hypothetical protein
LVPHAPQLFASVEVFTQAPLHSVCPAGQPAQEPLTHETPDAHACPHEPQLFESVCLLTHAPEQRLRPVAQLQLFPPLLQHEPLLHWPQPP